MKRDKNKYQAACVIRKYLVTEHAADIKDRNGDSPVVYGTAKWTELGIGGTNGAGIVWEGFYDWTRPNRIDKMQQLIEDTGFEVFPTAEWMVEIS